MKKYEEAKKDLVLNGFNEAKVNELTNLFVEDFLDSEYEKLGESLDMYIDEVRDGQILPNEFGVVKFAEIVNDNEEKESLYKAYWFWVEQWNITMILQRMDLILMFLLRIFLYHLMIMVFVVFIQLDMNMVL